MSFYPYEYFCGANVVVEVEGAPAHEIAGISYGIQESKMPLYGYSSTHFDAMARGQVLVQGSIIINYIHQDYLLRVIEVGKEYKEEFRQDGQYNNRELVLERTYEEAKGELFDLLANDENRDGLVFDFLADPKQNRPVASALENKFWGNPEGLSHSGFNPAGVVPLPKNINRTSRNPHDMHSPISLKVTFGERSPFNGYNGDTGVLISGVYFVGRGTPIRIDEEVIVEEYSFIGRNIHSLQSEPVQVSSEFNPVSNDTDFTLRSGAIKMPRTSPEPGYNELYVQKRL